MSTPIQTALLIDDAAIDQRVYKRVLDNSGLVGEVLTFLMATDALAYLKDHPDQKVDVIFLDINMPMMDGFEFLETATREFGADFAKVVVVMLTTSLNPGDQARAKEFDVVRAYVNKPLEVGHVRMVADLLADQR